MKTSCLDLKSLSQQFEQLRNDVGVSRDRNEADRRRAAELDEKIRKLTGSRELDILRKIGLDLETLQAHAKEDLQIVHHHLEAFKKLPRPDRLALSLDKERILRQLVQEQTEAQPFLFSPAFGCEPAKATQSVACIAELGEINVRAQSSGLGGAWGLEAITSQPRMRADLWWCFVPPQNGDLFVNPQVDIQGTVYIWSHDHWYTSTDAWLKLTLWCNLFQNYWEWGTPLAIVDEAGPNLSLSYWVNGRFVPSNSTTVVADVPVWIHIVAELEAFGRSDHALVEGDFFSGADKFIRVSEIEIRLNSF